MFGKLPTRAKLKCEKAKARPPPAALPPATMGVAIQNPFRKMSSKGRTKLKTCVSDAKSCKESFGEV